MCGLINGIVGPGAIRVVIWFIRPLFRARGRIGAGDDLFREIVIDAARKR